MVALCLWHTDTLHNFYLLSDDITMYIVFVCVHIQWSVVMYPGKKLPGREWAFPFPLGNQHCPPPRDLGDNMADQRLPQKPRVINGYVSVYLNFSLQSGVSVTHLMCMMSVAFRAVAWVLMRITRLLGDMLSMGHSHRKVVFGGSQGVVAAHWLLHFWPLL